MSSAFLGNVRFCYWRLDLGFLLYSLVGCAGEDLGSTWREPDSAPGALGGAGGGTQVGSAGTRAGGAGAVGMNGGGAVGMNGGGGASFAGQAGVGASSGGPTGGARSSGGTGGSPSGGGAAIGAAPSTGGSGASAGRRGRGGATTAGGESSTSAGTGGAANAGGGSSKASGCSVQRDGATGDEPGGRIPICCAPASNEKALIDAVFQLLNAHRAANGRSALAYDPELEAAVQGHCMHMSQHSFFAHEAPETSLTLPWTRATFCGTSANGENIARGQRTAAEVMTSWISSSGHNQNMLGAFSRVGIGYEDAGRYWGQLFGR